MYRVQIGLFGLLIGLLCAPQSGGAQSNPLERIVLTDTEAFGLLPAELVVAPVVGQAKWASDGKYILAVRESLDLTPEAVLAMLRQPGGSAKPPRGEISLVLWNARSRRSDVVWRAPYGAGSVEEFHWLPGSSLALAIVTQITPAASLAPSAPMTPGALPQGALQLGPGEFVRRKMLLRIDGATGRARTLREFKEDELLSLRVSPIQSLAVLEHTAFDGRDARLVLHVLQGNGVVGQPVAIPKGVSLFSIAWSEDGSLACLQCMDREARRAQKKAVIQWFQLHPRSGQITPLANAPKVYAAKPARHPLSLKSALGMAKEEETTRSLSLLWLESVGKTAQPRALVSAEATWSELSPKGDAILHFSQGAAWVTPLLRMSREEYEKLRRAALKVQTISNAKQAALGLIMYAQDYDENLPTGDGLNDKISPYVKNGSILEGLVYTFGGGPLSGIANPAQTELGYIPGPGGRAILFADGHVQWRDD